MSMSKKMSKLWIVITCYNEENVLPITSELFLNELKELISKKKISEDSRILFVNDGSKDNTWQIICELAKSDLEDAEKKLTEAEAKLEELLIPRDPDDDRSGPQA